MRFAHISIIPTLTKHLDWAQQLTTQMGKEFVSILAEELPFAINGDAQETLEEWVEKTATDLLFFSVENNKYEIQKVLNACRLLRIPYVILCNTTHKLMPLHKVLVPVSMLEEEVYKGEICSHLGRFTHSEIILLKAHDYGSKAQTNVNRICTAMDRFTTEAGHEFTYTCTEGKKDSFSINREAAERQKDFLQDLLILTASRDYGLDDIIFGPQERKCIMQAQVPVMLLNPRGDLFSLCD